MGSARRTRSGRYPHAIVKRRDTLISAALRHVRDAEQLLALTAQHPSPDQAFHLAGFGPECARKALLDGGWADKAIGHDFGEVGERALTFLLALDPVAHRYAPSNWGARHPALLEWTPEARYEKTGTRTPAQVDGVVLAARTTVDDAFFALWADGRLGSEAFR